MTQNPYQQGPPPGWAPQGPPPGYGPPPTQQWPPAGANQGYPPADVTGAASTPFNNPGAPGGGGDAPALAQLVGRLLLIKPYRLDLNVPPPAGSGGNPQDQVLAEVLVLDGPPIEHKLNRDGQVVAAFTPAKVAPFYLPTLYFKGMVITPQVSEFVPSRGLVLARLTKGQASQGKSAPYVLQDATPADEAVGQAAFARWDELKAASRPPMPNQFTGPAQAPQGPPPGYSPPNWGQAPQTQGPPPGYAPPNWGQ